MGLFNFFRQKNLSQKQKNFSKSIEQLIGFKPQNIKVYTTAFTHKSASDEWHNERLEFLGDAILNSVISEYLYHTYGDKNEGFLTRMRSKIVNRKHLNDIGKKLQLNILLDFKLNISDINQSSILGNTLEALIGAIYLDKGYKKTVQFIQSKILQQFVDIIKLEQTEVNFKSILLEYIQKEKLSLQYLVTETENFNKTKTYNALVLVNQQEMGKGSGKSKKEAEQIAAQLTLQHFLNVI